MKTPRNATLGEFIYSKIDKNEYLQEIYSSILYNYSTNLLNIDKTYDASIKRKNINIDDALRFADILSKSSDTNNSEKHKTWAQEIVALLNSLYPNEAKIKAYATSILANIGNYRGLQLIKTKYKSTSFLDELYSKFDLEYLSIPYQDGKYFFHSQKQIYDHLNDISFSYSGPTSMGKSLLMRMFIKEKILSGFKGNFAILVPTKALISEISSNIIQRDLQDELSKQNYKVVTSGNSLFFKQDNVNYIMVMTPERMLYTLISYPNISIDYLFIDEAHNISKHDGRATFFFKVTEMLMERQRKPHIILASPNIPNPEIYLTALPAEQRQTPTYLRTTFTPVSQLKYVFDIKNHEIKILNDHSTKSDKFEFISSIAENENSTSLMHKIIDHNLNKSNIVYCSGREKAVNLAKNYADSLPYLNNQELDTVANEVCDEIHKDYYLADLIKKGVAYHVGYLPVNIRTKIEDLYRNRKIKTIFCTSTLIEGVNLPADNLIVISCKMGKKGNMNQVEFRNLLGRVGRIEYNLYGNVFVIRNEQVSEKTIKNLLVDDVKDQKISLISDLTPIEKEYIVNQFVKGDSSLKKLPDQKDEHYDMMRKVGLILLRDITKDRNSVIKEQFNEYLDDVKIKKIKDNFDDKSKSVPKPDDDINVSIDQTARLIQAINNGLKYPRLLNGKIQYEDLVNFLYELKRIFRWDIYDSSTLGKGDQIRYYAVILARWMNGYGLPLLLLDTINHNQGKTISINNQVVVYDGSQYLTNFIIGDTLQIIENVILFSIANYFLRFSTEYKKLMTNGQPFDNDWYEYVEYGSTNPLTIFFQRNGLTRETADYIREHKDEFVVKNDYCYKLKKSLKECKKQSVSDEIKDIMFNVPELFID